jgi:hypothetical protein
MTPNSSNRKKTNEIKKKEKKRKPDFTRNWYPTKTKKKNPLPQWIQI